MFESILQNFRNNIYSNHYVLTSHAFEEMENDNLSIYDIESCVLSGKIIEKQKDIQTNENKFRIRGFSVDEELMEIVAKKSVTGKTVIITVYKLQ